MRKLGIPFAMTTAGVAIAAGGMVLATATADAKIVSSSNGAAAIIAAPASVCDDAPEGAENAAQEGFDEAQGVVLAAPVTVDGAGPGTSSLPGVPIAAGTLVDSHMIFLNTVGGGLTQDFSVTWTFDGAVLGVMSDFLGTLEAASSALLGNPGTAYGGPCTGAGQHTGGGNISPGAAPHLGRGMEAPGDVSSSDGYVIAGNTLTVGMEVGEPGDWIRVVTAALPPDINIDIKPGSDLNSINLGSGGVIPVAILGSASFDATAVDGSTCTLGEASVKMVGKSDKLLCSVEDVNGDGFDDLVCKFVTIDLGAELGDTEATIHCSAPENIEGTDSIRIVPPE